MKNLFSDFQYLAKRNNMDVEKALQQEKERSDHAQRLSRKQVRANPNFDSLRFGHGGCICSFRLHASRNEARCIDRSILERSTISRVYLSRRSVRCELPE